MSYRKYHFFILEYPCGVPQVLYVLVPGPGGILFPTTQPFTGHVGHVGFGVTMVSGQLNGLITSLEVSDLHPKLDLAITTKLEGYKFENEPVVFAKVIPLSIL